MGLSDFTDESSSKKLKSLVYRGNVKIVSQCSMVKTMAMKTQISLLKRIRVMNKNKRYEIFVTFH